MTARVSLEAGSTFGWERYVGPKGITIGIDEFGHSAPGEQTAWDLVLHVLAWSSFHRLGACSCWLTVAARLCHAAHTFQQGCN